ncbi:MAG: efflux RND transporter periplasmic adaptor subunit, partial [Betaproteobacteria bacterium]|nr:efflux RND transporter periplasmic adaptor subunit [Betaproteobacteria bacterium]
MKRKFWIIGGLTVAVVAGAGIVMAPQFAKADKPKPDAVVVPEFVPTELARAQVVPMPLEVSATGVLSAQRNATVRAKVSAEVKEVTVREGDSVTAGQVLMRLDTIELQHKLASQAGALAAAQARLASARKTRDMQQALLDQQYISRNAFDTAQSAYDAALGEVTSAQAQVALARESLGDAVVRAPMAGVVAKRFVQPGEKVNFDSPMIQIVDLASLELQAWVPPQSVALLRP